MTHGWRGRVGQFVRAGVGVILVVGPVGCVGPDKAKALTKPSMPGALPPPSNFSGAGSMPATPPGGVPASTASSATKSVPVTTASRTAATTPAPAPIPSTPTNLQESVQLMNNQTARPNQTTPVFASPTPGIQFPPTPRPAPPQPAAQTLAPVAAQAPAPSAPVPVSSAPPSIKSAGSPMGLSSVVPSDVPLPIAVGEPVAPKTGQPFPTPALPTAAGVSPPEPTAGPVMPAALPPLGS